MTETWAATTFQPAGVRTQVWDWRPILPDSVARRNSVQAVAKSLPQVVMTVRSMLRARPTGARAARKPLISAWP